MPYFLGCLNRTFMELKCLFRDPSEVKECWRLNRTFMELKSEHVDESSVPCLS